MKIVNLLMCLMLTMCQFSVNTNVYAVEEPLAQAEVTEALTSLIDHVEQDYLHDRQREQVVTRLQEALNQGEFSGVFSYGRLKIKLESMLQKVTGDAGFELLLGNRLSNSHYSSNVYLPGAIQTRLLDGDIGYLAIDGDLIDDNWPADIDKAMAMLSNSKALVIDLRSTGMSSLSLAEDFLGYFIPVGEPLSTATFARGHQVLLRSKGAENPVNVDMPVYLLTSPFVAGTWEFVAYTLKHAKRATIVGTATIGLGYMKTTKALSEHLSIRMAYAELIHPSTNDNWQGQGVMPDVSCAAADALSRSLRLIAGDLSSPVP